VAELGNTSGFSRDFFMDVAMGKIQGYRIKHVHGVNHDIDTGVEDIWSGGVHPYPFFPITAHAMEIVSTSVADLPVSTGAATVMVVGLNHKFEEQSEVVTMNGTVAAQLRLRYRRINGMRVVEGGALNNPNIPNAGQITVRISGAGAIASTIEIGDGKSLSSIYTVPRNHTAYIASFSANTGNGKDSHISLRKCFYHSVFQVMSHEELYQNIFTRRYVVPIILPAKTDIKCTATVVSNDTGVSTELCLVLVRKGY